MALFSPSAEDRERNVSQQMQNLHLEEEEEEEGDVVPELRAFFISVVDEADVCSEEDADGGLSHAHRLLQQYERSEGAAVRAAEGCGGGGGEEERYEKTRARHGDAAFSRFMKKIAACPQQILRYQRGGEPLLVSELPTRPAPAAAAAACGSCGGPRTLELQLMPALVSLLQRRRRTGEGGGTQGAGLEFGTVLVYTCAKSCWPAGSAAAVEEACLVQADPDQQLFG